MFKRTSDTNSGAKKENVKSLQSANSALEAEKQALEAKLAEVQTLLQQTEAKNQPVSKAAPKINVQKTPWDTNNFNLPSDFSGRKSKVCVVGSGNFGSTLAKVIAENTQESDIFATQVNMWVYDEQVPNPFSNDSSKDSLVKIINEHHQNVKYLPDVTLPSNLVAIASLEESVKDADLIVFVCPHQFLPRTCDTIKKSGNLKEGALAITCIKGMFAKPEVKLTSTFIEESLSIPCSALSGANVAKELANGEFCGATIGSKSKEEANVWHATFARPYYSIRTVQDVEGVQACGALKNIVALAAGFLDGSGFGTNTKSELLRQGMSEIIEFAQMFFLSVDTGTFLENCGMADMITTCFGGRNRRCGEAYFKKFQQEFPEQTKVDADVAKEMWNAVELEQLKGQKIAGLPTVQEAYEVIEATNQFSRFPLFTKTHEICYEGARPETILSAFTNANNGGESLPKYDHRPRL